MSSPSPPSSKRHEKVGLWALLLAHTLLFGSAFLASPHGTMADEEAEVPSVAEFLASGLPLNELPRLQYMPFCGGCTAEALMAWPAFELLGSSLWVWKLIPLAFGLLLMASVVAVGRALAVCLIGVVALPGIASRGADLSRSSWSARALHLPAAPAELGGGNRVWHPAPFLGDVPEASDPDRIPPPQRPVALRSDAFSVGGFGEGAPAPGMGPGDGERGFSRWLDQQPTVVRRAALMGYVHSRPSLLTAEASKELSYEALSLLEPFDPATRLELLEVGATLAPALAPAPDFRRPENTLEHLLPATIPEQQRPAGAWTVGYLGGRDLFVAQPLPGALEGADVAGERFDTDAAGHAGRGFSFAFGRRWGYSESARESFLVDVPPEHRADALSGLEGGTRWKFMPGTWRD